MFDNVSQMTSWHGSAAALDQQMYGHWDSHIIYVTQMNRVQL